jgi:hypothetical protein
MATKSKSSRSRREFVSKLDLLEIRRYLAALRSRYASNRQIVKLLNCRLANLYYLREPFGLSHEQHLIREIGGTLDALYPLILESDPPEGHALSLDGLPHSISSHSFEKSHSELRSGE